MVAGPCSVASSSEYLDTLSPVGKADSVAGLRREIQIQEHWQMKRPTPYTARLEQTWAGRTAETAQPAWIERQMRKIDQALDAMGLRAWARRRSASGIHLSLSDIAVGCAQRAIDFRFHQLDWRARHANLARLRQKSSCSASFQDTTPAWAVDLNR